MSVEFMYRYEWKTYAVLGIDGDAEAPKLPNPKVELIVFDVMSETKKGYWLGFKSLSMKMRWVSKVAKKRYAHPTKEEALQNFITRTENRCKILEWDASCCRLAIGRAKKMLEELQFNEAQKVIEGTMKVESRDKILSNKYGPIVRE